MLTHKTHLLNEYHMRESNGDPHKVDILINTCSLAKCWQNTVSVACDCKSSESSTTSDRLWLWFVGGRVGVGIVLISAEDAI